jgi:hypothetical protein
VVRYTACPREVVARGGHPLGLIEYLIERVCQAFFARLLLFPKRSVRTSEHLMINKDDLYLQLKKEQNKDKVFQEKYHKDRFCT